MTCKEKGCQNKAIAKGMCRRHYDRNRERKIRKGTWKGKGRDSYKKSKNYKICKVDGCKTRSSARGFCKHHYYIFREEMIKKGKWNKLKNNQISEKVNKEREKETIKKDRTIILNTEYVKNVRVQYS